MMNRLQQTSRRFLHSTRASAKVFNLPEGYRPNKRVTKKLPFLKCIDIWYKSLRKERLETLQNELVDLMIPESNNLNKFKRFNQKVVIDKEGNHINELCLEMINDPKKRTKHIVFIHGYGASLGCFARNFQLINKFKDMNYNYKIHFLDNISFGLSSNPKMESFNRLVVEKCPEIKINDSDINGEKKLYNKYYKLVDSYEVDADEFKKYQENFSPILQQLNEYYTSAIEKWRIASKIEKIDYLIGHSYGGYWSGSYSVKYPDNLQNLILLSPVGVERHVHAITNNTLKGMSGKVRLEPNLDPSSFYFLSRIPIILDKVRFLWYTFLPYVPRLLKLAGPFGVSKYYKMWYSKLFKINNLIAKRGGAEKLFTNSNDLIYGTNTECLKIIEYLYNSTTNGTNSDLYIKYLLTPSTVSKYPLFDKFASYIDGPQNKPDSFDVHFVYGQFDFMNAEAGEKLAKWINDKSNKSRASFNKIREGGHNLYIDNPFETNDLIHSIISKKDSV